MQRLGPVLVWLLWNSRYMVAIAVVASVFISLVLFFISSVAAFELPSHIGAALDPNLVDTQPVYYVVIARIASIVDGYLFAAIMLIFGLGLYELFIGKLEVPDRSEFAEKILLVRDLDDLKDRLAKVIFLILLVKYFEFALLQRIDSPLSLLYLAVGILLVAIALWFTAKA